MFAFLCTDTIYISMCTCGLELVYVSVCVWLFLLCVFVTTFVHGVGVLRGLGWCNRKDPYIGRHPVTQSKNQNLLTFDISITWSVSDRFMLQILP